MSRSTTEYCTLIKATSQLTRAVKNDLVQLSVELVSNQLISVDNGTQLRNGNVDVVERAAKLVALVTNKVEQDKKNYYIFVGVLMKNRSTYKEVLELLEPVYSTGGHIYTKGACAVSTINQPWYHRKLSREEAEKRLGEMDGDSFLVRESTTQSGRLILSVKNEGTFYHFFIERGVGTYEVEGTNLLFPSPVELIDFYKENGLPESDSEEIIRLRLPCNFTSPPFVIRASSSPLSMSSRPSHMVKRMEIKRRSHDRTMSKLGGQEEPFTFVAVNSGQLDNDHVYKDNGDINKMTEPPLVISNMPASTYYNPDETQIGSLDRGRENLSDIAETNEVDFCHDVVANHDRCRLQTPMPPSCDNAQQGENPPAPSPAPVQRKSPLKKKPPIARKPTAFKNMRTLSISSALTEPLAPLQKQKYFHGSISRVKAEALFEKDGQFLIREYSQQPGQYVLSGMANGQPQHLLLMDKEGRVKSKDYEFESIPRLVAYFSEKKAPPIVIGDAQVFLSDPIIVSTPSYKR